MTPPPTGTLTFLFTDIAGSTRLWDTQHQAMKAAHARQADLIAEAVAAHQGHLVRNRGEGDSTFSVFQNPAHALAAATEFQRALFAETWPTDTPLRVRAALHVGPAELREGDYNSTAVNRCARLRSLASGGQTLVSGAVAAMVESLLPEGVSLRSLGSHRLKDLERAEEVYQLCHPDLPTEFPALRSLDTLPTNLPQQLNRFIGREQEMEQIQQLLANNRLVTLRGTGGAGKTRLALQAGAELLDAYPDGVWFVELAPLASPDLTPQTVAATLGLREETGKPLTQTLVEFLQSRTLLLILDNCEHLIDACARLSETLLRACSHLKILATSREALNIPGEQTYRLPSLSMPDLKHILTAADLVRYEAPQLFLDRATSVKSEFRVTDETASTLAALCQRLDGIPLALELAAARVRSLSLEDIYHRLDHQFRLLTGGSRTALPRQQTLRALIDWSYDLLAAQERTLLARLSVFSGGWTLEAAEAVCADRDEGESTKSRESTKDTKEHEAHKADSHAFLEEWEVLDLLSSLVDKSLAVAEEQNGTVRYRMLQTIRQYGAEKLEERREEPEIRRKHRDWYLQLAKEAERKLVSAEQAQWLEILEAEHDNLRQAISFCLEKPGEAPGGLRLAGAIQRFWWIRGYFFEGRERYAAVLAHSDAQEPTKTRANALNGAGVLASLQGDYAVARTHFEESLAIRRKFGDRVGIATCLNNLGNVARELDDYPAAHALYEEAMTLRRELGDKPGLAGSLNNLGMVSDFQGDYSSARALYDEALEIRRELGDPSAIANSLNNLGLVVRKQGDHALGRSLFEESLTIQRKLGDRAGMAHSLSNLGNVVLDLGDHAAARSLQEEALATWNDLGNRAGVARALTSLGRLAQEQNDFVLARSRYRESLGIHRELLDRSHIVLTLEALSDLAIREDRRVLAVQLWGAAERLRNEIACPLPYGEPAAYARALSETRQALGESTFAAAWAEGMTLPWEQAAALALETPIETDPETTL